MKIKFTLSLLLLLTLVSTLSARLRTVDEAKNVAISHYNGLQLLRSVQTEDFELVYTGQANGLRASSDPYYYVFNVSGKKGYVMVSGDDRITPVLGYSTEGKFDASNLPSNLLGWLEGYEQQIRYLLDSVSTTLPALKSTLAVTADNYPESVAPFITTEWDQVEPYNALCPMDGNIRSVTGCVATAMAQILYYYKWPQKATGKISYHSETLNLDISADLSNYIFNYDKMKEIYDENSSEEAKREVANLMYAAGVSLEMDYSAAGSGAYFIYLARSFFNNFGYDEGVNFMERNYYNTDEWVSILKSELASGYPIAYGGQSYMGAHTFIFDGYDRDGLFHVNWGWGGVCDGYFKLDLLDADGYLYPGFSYNQHMVYGIRKPGNDAIKPEVNLRQILFDYRDPVIQQDDTMFVDGYFFLKSIRPHSLEVALSLYQDDKLLQVLSDTILDISPFNIYPTQINDTLPRFTLPKGNYELKYKYRLSDEKEWKDPLISKVSDTYNIVLLESTDSEIKVVPMDQSISVSDFTVTGEFIQYYEVVFNGKITNHSSRELSPKIAVFYLLNDESNGFELFSKEGFYLLPGETKEIKIPGQVKMEPGNYRFYLANCDDNGYYYENQKVFIDAVVKPYEDPTANDNLAAPEGTKVSVSNRILSVVSPDVIQELCVFTTDGRLTNRIHPTTTEVKLSVDTTPPGLRIVRVKIASVWHSFKIVF